MNETLRLIDESPTDGQYGMRTDRLIIDHPTHGRLLVCDGYGGENQLCGGAYRWRDGYAAKLLPTDTFAVLDHDAIHTIAQGRDTQRPRLTWDGYIITALAKSVGR